MSFDEIYTSVPQEQREVIFSSKSRPVSYSATLYVLGGGTITR